MTIASISRDLRRGLAALDAALPGLAEARVVWPADVEGELEVASTLVGEREPRMRGCVGFVDGLSITISDDGDPFVQNAYYNGWYAGCRVQNILVYGPSGCIIYASCNAPGSWHDSTVALFSPVPFPFSLPIPSLPFLSFIPFLP